MHGGRSRIMTYGDVKDIILLTLKDNNTTGGF